MLKIEPRLEEEISGREGVGMVKELIPVIIELAHQVEPASEEDPQVALARTEQRADELQRPVIARLQELGAGNIEGSFLTSAIFTALTPDQIRDIGGHPDVKLIRLNRADQVTT